MADHAETNEWAGSWCNMEDASVVMEEINGRMVATTRSEHRFTAYNNTGADKRDVRCEYNHTINIWNAGLNKWEEVHRDAPEEGFDVDADHSYNHVNFQDDEHVPFVRENQIFMEPDRRYQLDTYIECRLPGDNLKDVKQIEFSTPEF